MEIDYEKHYTADYFQGKKTYTDNDGKTQLYHGPSLTWGGFDLVADALAMVLPKGSLLDVGCSAGDLASRLLKRGFDSYGVDISQYAIDNAVPDMNGRVGVADISKHPTLTPNEYDIVISTDLLEHLYEEDLADTFKWMVSKSKKWLFFCVATASFDKEAYSIGKGEKVPAHLEGAAVSGHVNVRPWQYWVRFFKANALTVRWDLGYIFQMQREKDAGWRDTGGWNMSTTWILEKK